MESLCARSGPSQSRKAVISASMPDFSWNSLVNGEYIDGIESYVTDQFAGRDQWVGVKTLSEKWMGKKGSGGVYFASDGSLIEMFDSVDRSLYQSNLEYIKEFEEECMAVIKYRFRPCSCQQRFRTFTVESFSFILQSCPRRSFF